MDPPVPDHLCPPQTLILLQVFSAGAKPESRAGSTARQRTASSPNKIFRPCPASPGFRPPPLKADARGKQPFRGVAGCEPLCPSLSSPAVATAGSRARGKRERHSCRSGSTVLIRRETPCPVPCALEAGKGEQDRTLRVAPSPLQQGKRQAGLFRPFPHDASISGKQAVNVAPL